MMMMMIDDNNKIIQMRKIELSDYIKPIGIHRLISNYYLGILSTSCSNIFIMEMPELGIDVLSPVDVLLPACIKQTNHL